jgi:hypothetical protein
MNRGAFDGTGVIILPSKRMTTPLSNYRDIVCLLFRVADPQARFSDMDRLLHKLHDVLSEAEESTRPPFLEPMFVRDLLRPPTPPTLVIHPDQKAEEITATEIVAKPEPSTVRNHVVNLPPTAFHVVKLAEAPSDSAILENLKQDTAEDMTEDTASTPDVGLDEEDDVDEDDVCSTSSSEPDEEDDEEEEEDDVEEEDNAEEDNDEEEDEEDEEEDEEAKELEQQAEDEKDMALIKIDKVKYYWSPTSKRVYEYTKNGYDNLIGTYVGGKIVPK